ncbi:MAG: hypothetical protein LBG58_12085 [Planctomycetaceae bacterium]|jgi:hypothetical protein|nr:hypothetical protein [Planctomycetaceae bacterium]
MIAELAKQFISDVLNDMILTGTDENSEPVETKIKQLCIGYPDERAIDETNGESFYPIVIIDENGSDTNTINRDDSPEISPQYTTGLQIWVISNNKEEAKTLCYVFQTIVFDGFTKLRLNSDETKIDNVSRGRKDIVFADFLGNGNTWQASRLLSVLNRIEP